MGPLILALFVPGVAFGARAPQVQAYRLNAEATSDQSFGEVADFTFTERSGRTISRADLAGRVWVVGFFFTRCPNPCPLLTANMRRLQDELASTPVQLVSISVDPNFDSPEVLRDYATSYTADEERWWFLTGDEAETFALMRESFALSVDRLPDKDVVLGLHVTHATRLVVVDGEARVRGYYDGESAEGLEQALARARFLAGVRPPTRLPAINASLNGIAAIFLWLGYRAIRAGRRERHAKLMRLAFLASAVFLACYLYYHFVVTAEVGPTRYNGAGWRRPAYLALLLSHTLLAAINLPMVLRTFWLAHKERWEAHRRLARWTFPIWLYVSVTGVLVYVVLYHLNPPAA